MAVKSHNLTRKKVGITAVITVKHVLKEHGHNVTETCLQRKKFSPDEPCLTLKCRVKSHLPSAGIIRNSPYSSR